MRVGIEQMFLLLLSQNGGNPDLQVNPYVTMILALFVVAAAFIMVIFTRNRIIRRNANRQPARKQIDSIKSRVRNTDQATNLMVDMLETGQRLAAQLDNKAEKLQQLIELADRRIVALGGEDSLEALNAPVIMTSSQEEEEDLFEEKEEDNYSLTTEVLRLVDEGYSPVEIAQRLGETTGNVELIISLNKNKDS